MSSTVQESNSAAARPSLVRLGLQLSVLVAIILYVSAFYFSISDLSLDSRAYPQAIILVLLVLVLSQSYSEVRNWWRRNDTTRVAQVWHRWKRTVLCALSTIVFVSAIGVVGFYESLALYGLILLPILGVRRPLMVLTFNAGMVAGVYLLFDLMLNVRLPSGLVVG